jgi:para-aminobenzoate synthetase component 1
VPGLCLGRRPFLLLSATPDGERGRFSFAGADPFTTLTVPGDAEGLEALRGVLEEHRIDGTGLPTPLPAGAVGFLSYDLGRRIERLPSRAEDDLGVPDVSLCLYDTVATWDHATGEAFLTTTGPREKAEALRDLLLSPVCTEGGPPRLTSTLRSTFTRADYLEAVRRVKDLIAAGDVFQVNLSQRFSVEVEEPGHVLFPRLVRANPAPFSAWLTSSCGAEVLSVSPERFLRQSGRDVTTSPIKGTRPRAPDRGRDRELARELLESEKDLAELTMIVDLMRSDLGKVAEFGSVRVAELPGLTSHRTVHHLHGTVTARLAEGRDTVDLLRSSFPPGSITGAPKVRAMEIIEELEPVRRGVYTGAIGYFSFTGEVDLSVAIRTMVLKEGRASFSVGGGIVADSDPAEEYEETIHKGRGLAAALGYRL